VKADLPHPSVLSPTRRALNPVLADDALFHLDGTSVNVFYTPFAQQISRHVDLLIAGSAGICLLLAWLLHVVNGPGPMASLFTLLAFTIGGAAALPDVWEKLSTFRVDVDLLMLLGAGLAAYIGSPFEGAMLLFLFALSGAMEAYALRRTQAAIIALRDLSPKEATVIEAGQTRRVPLRYVSIGSRVLVRPGEKVPVDGVVEDGASSVDESAITGESIPRDCRVGENVFAGTQNLNGRLEVRATKAASDTTVAKIVELVTSARHHPARAQRLIDRIGPTYSLIVIVGSLAVGGLNALAGVPAAEAIRRGIAVLIVASPCALIIATPVAYLSAIAAAARRGVLIKGGAHLEAIARAGVVLFDKTGTLTTGRVRLVDVVPVGSRSEAETLRYAGAVERSSHHPLAEAVVRAMREQSLEPHAITDYQATPGEGAVGRVNGSDVRVVRPDVVRRWISAAAAETLERRAKTLRTTGKTVSAVVIDGEAGLLAFQDTLRETGAASVERLRRQGVRRIEMLTGDHEDVARGVAETLKLDGFQAGLAPQDKLTQTRRFREMYGPVILVGDGINDAPALAHADVGIAMGAMGTEIAMDAAHVVLMKDRIELVPWLHQHAKRSARIVAQNLAVALSVIGVLSVFAGIGDVPLPLAVVGHEGSTVLVAINALRLLRSSD